MAPIDPSIDYLPDIDTTPESDLSAIKSPLLSQLPSNHSTNLHPSLGSPYSPKFPPLITAAHKNFSTDLKTTSKAIDLSRYGAPEAPSDNSSSSWQTVLDNSYVNLTYLSIRRSNLSLLEAHGKNTWLLHNDGLEKELAKLEGELAAVKAEGEVVDAERREARAVAKAEWEVLDESWRRGVSRAIETEMAAEGVRREVLDARRQGGG